MTALYRIMLRTSVTRGRVLAFLAGGALLDLIAYSIRVSDFASRESDLFQLLDYAAIALYIPVVVLVFSTSSLGDLAQDGTLVYVWLRPVARWKVVVMALAATLTITLPLTVIPVWLGVLLAGAGVTAFTAATVATVLANLAYSALFTGFGLRVRHALIFGLGYVVVWEEGIASIGKGPAAVSIRHYVESLMAHMDGQSVPNLVLADQWTSVIVLVALFAVGIAMTSVLLTRQDVP